MDLHVVLDRNRPLRAQLEEHLRDGVRTRRPQPGIRLPPTRLLASELGVSRGVVVEAYAQLTAEGYLRTHGSGGTRVADGLIQAQPRLPGRRSPRIRFDLRAGLPDPSLFPRRAWSAAAAKALRELPDAALLYGPSHGQRHLRHAIAAHLGRSRAIAVDEAQTFITCGASHALTLLWSTLRAAGVTHVAHEDPAWERIPETVIQAGLEPVPVRVDGSGLSVADLERGPAQAVVVSPAHQYPTGAVMHPRRRAALIRWARETGGLIVEDDYDAEYRFSGKPIAPLRSVASGCVAYVGTTSKILAPALRLGWLIVPARLAAAVSAEHAVSLAQPSVVSQAGFAALLENGDIARHLRRTRTAYRARRTALLAAAAGEETLKLSGGSAGLHLMCWLPREVSEAEVVAEARRAGVAVDGLHTACSVTQDLRPALVLGYGAIQEAAIPTAFAQLAACVRQVASGCELNVSSATG